MIFLFLTDCLRPTAQPPPEVSTSLVSLHLQLASTSPLLSFFFFFVLFLSFLPFSLFILPWFIPCRPVSSVGHTLLQPSWTLLCLDFSSGSPVLPVPAVDAFLSSFCPHSLSSPFPLSSIPFPFSFVVSSAWELSWWLRLSHPLTPCEFFSSCDHTPHSLVALLGDTRLPKRPPTKVFGIECAAALFYSS